MSAKYYSSDGKIFFCEGAPFVYKKVLPTWLNFGGLASQVSTVMVTSGAGSTPYLRGSCSESRTKSEESREREEDSERGRENNHPSYDVAPRTGRKIAPAVDYLFYASSFPGTTRPYSLNIPSRHAVEIKGSRSSPHSLSDCELLVCS